MKAGDTFVSADRSLESHVWVVVSDPDVDPHRVVIANMTTYTIDREAACVLHPGDHPLVRHETCVNYRRAQVATNDGLDRLVARGSLRLRQPVSAEVLDRIREGAARARWIEDACWQVLEQQGLLDSQ